MEWDCWCIRRRLIIICTKYFVIVNYGAATGFRGQDQAPSRGRDRKTREGFCVRLSQSKVEIRARLQSLVRSGPLQPSKPLSTTLVFHHDGYRSVFLIIRVYLLKFVCVCVCVVEKLLTFARILSTASIKRSGNLDVIYYKPFLLCNINVQRCLLIDKDWK